MEEYDNLQPEETGEAAPPRQSQAAAEAYEWVEWLAGIVVFVVLVLTFAFRTVGVFGESMELTLIEGDSLIVSRLLGEPRAGDIVAITQPNDINKPLIKRVIATGGQTVDIDFERGEVYVDGAKLAEPYTNTPTNRSYDLEFPQTVPEGCLFVMGDNRNSSWDSRDSHIGMIDTRYVLGRSLFRFAPLDRMGRP